jgi:hypothetical protein
MKNKNFECLIIDVKAEAFVTKINLQELPKIGSSILIANRGEVGSDYKVKDVAIYKGNPSGQGYIIAVAMKSKVGDYISKIIHSTQQNDEKSN